MHDIVYHGKRINFLLKAFEWICLCPEKNDSTAVKKHSRRSRENCHQTSSWGRAHRKKVTRSVEEKNMNHVAHYSKRLVSWWYQLLPVVNCRKTMDWYTAVVQDEYATADDTNKKQIVIMLFFRRFVVMYSEWNQATTRTRRSQGRVLQDYCAVRYGTVQVVDKERRYFHLSDWVCGISGRVTSYKTKYLRFCVRQGGRSLSVPTSSVGEWPVAEWPARGRRWRRQFPRIVIPNNAQHIYWYFYYIQMSWWCIHIPNHRPSVERSLVEVEACW